jgi:hypothetical protein
MVALNLIVMVGSLLASGNPAQYPATNRSPQYSVEFQDDQVRVLRVSLRAGEATPVEAHPDAVLIYLTADLDGRVPDAVATWQPMGTYGLQNHARTSFEALLVELIAPMRTGRAHWSRTHASRSPGTGWCRWCRPSPITFTCETRCSSTCAAEK